MNKTGEMSDYDYLALKLVQTAERFPDCVGTYGAWITPKGDRCFVGAAGGINHLCQPGNCNVTWTDPRIHELARTMQRPLTKASDLAARAIWLNDEGWRWGQIPKLLGLVPGEADAQDLDSLDGVDRGRLNSGVPAVSEPAPDGVALVEVS